jgi:hypothetical protein
VILDKQRVTLDEVARHVCLSPGSAHRIIEDRLVFIKFVQDDFQNNSQEGTSVTVPLNSYRKEGDAFLDAISMGRYVDPPLLSRKQTPGYGMEISDIASQKEVQNSTIGEVNDVEAF